MTRAGRVLVAGLAPAGDRLAKQRLVREAVARLTGHAGRQLAVSQRCGACGGPHGRPRVLGAPGVHVSLADKDGLAVAAAAFHPVGVDLERVEYAPPRRVLERVLSDRERAGVATSPRPGRAFTRQWVRKEALVKIGVCRLGDLDRLDLSPLPLDGGWGRTRRVPVEGGAVRLTEWLLIPGSAVLGLAEADRAPIAVRADG